MKLRESALRLFFGALGVIIALLAAEAAIRIFAASAPSLPKSDRPLFYYDVERDPSQDPFFPGKKPGSFRISVVGDSFTTPFKVQFDDAFPARLERMLNLSPGRRRVEVINCGVAGNSSSSELPIVRRSLDTGTDLVILQVTLNDPQPKPFAAESEEFRKRFGKYRPGPFWKSIFTYWKSGEFAAERMHNRRTETAYRKYFSGMYRDPGLWDDFVASLQKMKTAANEKNVPLTAVIFPLFEFLENDYPFAELHGRLRTALDSAGIVNLDLLPLFTGMHEMRLQVRPSRDSHPNEIAHRLAAEKIYLWLEKEQILPREFNIRRKSKKMIERKVRLPARAPHIIH